MVSLEFASHFSAKLAVREAHPHSWAKLVVLTGSASSHIIYLNRRNEDASINS